MLLSKDDWLGWVQLLFVLLFLEINMWQIKCHSLARHKNEVTQYTVTDGVMHFTGKREVAICLLI